VVIDEVIYPKSDLAGPDGVRINIIMGYSISAIFGYGPDRQIEYILLDDASGQKIYR